MTKYLYQVVDEPASTIVVFEKGIKPLKNRSNVRYIEFEELKDYVQKYPDCVCLAPTKDEAEEAERIADLYNLYLPPIIKLIQYKVYIPSGSKNSGTLLEPNYDKKLFSKDIFDFEEGIDLLLKDSRGIYLPLELETEENLKYFRDLGFKCF